MIRCHLAVLAVLFCVTTPGWSDATMKTHSNRKSTPIWNICVVPAEATLTRVGMKGGASRTKESQEWAEKLEAAVKHAITEAGAKVAGDLSTGEQQGDDAARQSVLRLRQKYKSIGVLLRKKPGGVEKGRYTLGDEIALLPCAREADSIAFVDAGGVSSTNGRKAFDVLAGGLTGLLMAQARYDIWVALVDAKTGQVTACVHAIASGGKTEMDPEEVLSKSLAGELKKVHVGWEQPHTPPK